MQTPSESPRWHTELYADFCGALEGYAAIGEATKDFDRLCGKLWNCTDTAPNCM
jgi:hypothetical protein